MIGIVITLLFAWILALFGFDKLVISGTQELFGVHMTIVGYYFSFVLWAIFFSIIRIISNGKK